MTQTAMEIQSEIDKTDLRITELEMERERQTAAVAATEKAFIDGTADVAKLNDEQGSLSILTQTIESLRSTYQRLTSAFGNQSEAEARREQIKKMTDAANDVEPLLNQYLETRNEFNDIVSKYAETLINQATAYQKKQAEFQAINAQLKTPASNSEIQISDTARRLASATFFNHPPLEYSEVISRAENQLGSKLNRIAQAKRQSDYNSMKTAV
jgi:DNA repair exonuclease SbcCD ATPase subunit